MVCTIDILILIYYIYTFTQQVDGQDKDRLFLVSLLNIR